MSDDPRERGTQRGCLARCLRSSWRAWLLWLVVVLLLVLDWRTSTPHERFAEPMPLALGNGPAADAGHCSLAPTR